MADASFRRRRDQRDLGGHCCGDVPCETNSRSAPRRSFPEAYAADRIVAAMLAPFGMLSRRRAAGSHGDIAGSEAGAGHVEQTRPVAPAMAIRGLCDAGWIFLDMSSYSCIWNDQSKTMDVVPGCQVGWFMSASRNSKVRVIAVGIDVFWRQRLCGAAISDLHGGYGFVRVPASTTFAHKDGFVPEAP